MRQLSSFPLFEAVRVIAGFEDVAMMGSRRFPLLASVIDTCRWPGHFTRKYLQRPITPRRQGLALLP